MYDLPHPDNHRHPLPPDVVITPLIRYEPVGTPRDRRSAMFHEPI
jgi:hypothetical protein